MADALILALVWPALVALARWTRRRPDRPACDNTAHEGRAGR